MDDVESGPDGGAGTGTTGPAAALADRPLGASGPALVLAAGDALMTPAGALRLLPDGPGLRAELDGVPLARLARPLGEDGDDRPGLLVLDDEPALLLWEGVRPGGWARPRRLVVRWRRRAWVVLAHGTQRELHPHGRAEGAPLVRLLVDGGSHRVEWAAGASAREVALAAVVVRGAAPRAFRTALPDRDEARLPAG